MTSTDTPEPGGHAAARPNCSPARRWSGAAAPRRAGGTDGRLARLAAGRGRTRRRGVALVAVGGYGRGELSPRSDLDLLLLHDGVDPSGRRARRPALVPGLGPRPRLDHSVRTLAEAARWPRADLKAQLGLLDARHIAGDAELTAALRTARAGRLARPGAARGCPNCSSCARERAERHGELAFLLEPDLKEARGGLRDVTALRRRSPPPGSPTRPARASPRPSQRLLDVRDALHLVTGRATDRLALQDQDQVAAALGLLDADTLLRQIYEAARTIAYAGDVTWRDVDRVLRGPAGRAARPFARRSPAPGAAGAAARGAVPRRPLAEGVVEQDGEVVLARAARPARDPVLVLRAAAAAAQAGPAALPPRCTPAGRRRPGRCPRPGRPRRASSSVTLLGAGEPDRAGLGGAGGRGPDHPAAAGLGAGALPAAAQPGALWTVDRHLIETAVRAAALTRRVDRPDLLLVAALLHDIGKGWPGDHSRGRRGDRRATWPPGWASTRTTPRAWPLLVRHHLTLIETATRRDPDDPATVDLVAKTVGTAQAPGAAARAHRGRRHSPPARPPGAPGGPRWSPTWSSGWPPCWPATPCRRRDRATVGRARSGSPSRRLAPGRRRCRCTPRPGRPLGRPRPTNRSAGTALAVPGPPGAAGPRRRACSPCTG